MLNRLVLDALMDAGVRVVKILMAGRKVRSCAYRFPSQFSCNLCLLG